MDDPSRKGTGTPGDILADWFNQILVGMCNDPAMKDLWAAMKAGGQDACHTGLDPYLIMGLEKTATSDQVRSRYRELAIILHPDTARGKGTVHLFKLVTVAYQQINREKGW